MADFLLYGAYGYTGKLIVEWAKKKNWQLLLAGRSEAPLHALSEASGFPYSTFDLNNSAALDTALGTVPIVLHAAGPFIHTARPMMEACLRTGTHYLDITGEIDVFELAHGLDARARAAGITLLPGVGFDVVPTDCLAAYLKQQMPEAVQLQLAFTSEGGGVSPGTARTAIEGLGQPNRVRRDGRIVDVPPGKLSLRVAFPHRELECAAIPWGDVSTAYHTTGTPNIETYLGLPGQATSLLKAQHRFGWLLRNQWVQRKIRQRVLEKLEGPTSEQRRRARSYVWGAVYDAEGRWQSATLSLPETYTLTAQTALLILEKFRTGSPPVGFQTPAGAFGPDLILEVPDTERADGQGVAT